jgi:hypothetical protein
MMDEIGGIVDKADSQNRQAVICRRGGKTIWRINRSEKSA